MPEATPFTSFGSIYSTDPSAALFTGFPFCPRKVDVSVYDYWTTLSGYNKVDADASIEPTGIIDSHVYAMNLYWNLDGWSGTFEVLTDSISSLSIDGDDWELGDDELEGREFGGGVEILDDLPPVERTCYKNYKAIKYLYKDPGGFGDDTIFRMMGRNLNQTSIVRMYNGDTSNELNFVGYGVGEQLVLASDAFSRFIDVMFVSYGYFFNGDNLVSYIQIPLNGSTIIDMVGQAWGLPSESDWDTLDWAGLNFLYTEAGGYSFRFETNSMTFYDYVDPEPEA